MRCMGRRKGVRSARPISCLSRSRCCCIFSPPLHPCFYHARVVARFLFFDASNETVGGGISAGCFHPA